jgi:hypothetical protein
MKPIRIQVDQYRPVYDYEECPIDGPVNGIAAALIAYNVRLLHFIPRRDPKLITK